MPTYDYKCKEHGTFEKFQRMVDHARADCPTCGSSSAQILTRPPGLDIEGMSKAGCPSAHETVGDRIEARHRAVDQHHRPASR
jgi:putative FmdB family regulatory protein